MEIINNISKTLKEDLMSEMGKGADVSIAAACFSIYAYKELKKQLEGVNELRFLFTSPTFVSEKAEKSQREFYIPRLNRERSLYGSDFEVKLRNELTQKAIAKECADWIKKRVKFRSNVTNESMQGFITIKKEHSCIAYAPVNSFTTVDLGSERGNVSYTMINKIDSPNSRQYLDLFNTIWNDSKRMQDVTEEVIEGISNVYKENSPSFIYFLMLYNIFKEFLDDLSDDELPNEAVGFKESAIWKMLYDFQKDAALAIINKLEKYNGCILADSVGLGKTFTALAVIKYYENRNRSVLVLCPKKLSGNWNTYKDNYVNNPIASDRLRYDVLYHTDLSRETGKSNGLDLSRLNWGAYDLVVIDESHNFRNGGDTSGNEKENRYLKLMNKVIRAGVKTKVLMLSATPVNNRFYDLRNQLQLAYEGDHKTIDEKLKIKGTIDDVFNKAQKAFNAWIKLDVEERTTEKLMQTLSFDFFEILDSVTIARSRKHIEKQYNMDAIGTFPARLPPISLRPQLSTLDGAIDYNSIYERLMMLNLSVYTPSNFIFESKYEKYFHISEKERMNLTQMGRERGIQHLMSINLLKRLESSIHSFRLTLTRILTLVNSTIEKIDNYSDGNNLDLNDFDLSDLDADDQNIDFFTVGKRIKIDLGDVDRLTWRNYLEKDADILMDMMARTNEISPAFDNKLQILLQEVKKKIETPINPGNKKIIIFTAFTDTAEYLYNNVSSYVKENFKLDTAMITGSTDGRTTIPKLRCDFNTILTCFSPLSKEKELLLPNNPAEIDVLIATDCISEGQNLQDCDFLINYDIHWNPVRIIQRFGRIDRIGSQNNTIQLMNFWPDMTLDDYINLKERVETRMRISVMTSTGDDDPINVNEKGDLEYRKQQLKRLQEEVVDIEEMQNGISIMDLGLNEFRSDLLEYIKQDPEIEKSPHGLHAAISSNEDCPPGVIYLLKNVNNEININDQNRLHPFYMVYIGDGGDIICDHLSPKKLLGLVRQLCKYRTDPDANTCTKFNKDTNDGRNMERYSHLLEGAITSIIDRKDQTDIDSLFRTGETSALMSSISGIDDFELICFLAVK